MSVVPYQNLPLADEGRRWDSSAAEKRVRRWAGADDGPNAKYRKAFVWFDGDNADNFGSYKLPIADVIGGKLTGVPRAILSAGAVVGGARGGVDIPAKEMGRVKAHLVRYYRRLERTPPWQDRKGR